MTLHDVIEALSKDIHTLNRIKVNGAKIGSSNSTARINWNEDIGELDIIIDANDLDIVLASLLNNGFLSTEDFARLRDWETRVPQIETDVRALQGVIRLAAHLGILPTQTELTEHWESIRGAAPNYGATIVNLDQEAPRGHVWTLLETATDVFEWVDRGIDTVGFATETTPGIVRSTSNVWSNRINANGEVILNYRLAGLNTTTQEYEHGLMSAKQYKYMLHIEGVLGHDSITYTPVMT